MSSVILHPAFSADSGFPLSLSLSLSLSAVERLALCDVDQGVVSTAR